MRSVSALACAALCLGATGARAEDDQAAKDEAFERAAAADAAEGRKAGLALPAATTDELARIAERKKHAPPPLGLLVGAGFPEGIAADLVYRPVTEVRLFAGPMWNYVAWGVQGGLTLVPWQLGVNPILSIEGGRYFGADATFLAGKTGGVPAEIEPLLKHVSYDYASAHVGIEIGTRDAFAITVLAGLSYVSATAKGTATAQVDVTDAYGNPTTATVSFTDPHVRGTMPSVKLGVQMWF